MELMHKRMTTDHGLKEAPICKIKLRLPGEETPNPLERSSVETMITKKEMTTPSESTSDVAEVETG